MTPEQIKHKVAQLKRAIYTKYEKHQNAVTVALYIKTKLKMFYTFVFQFAPADFYYHNIRESAVRYFHGTELKAHFENFLPQFLTVFNDIKPTDPIQNFYFAKDLPDFIHYKQSAQIQFNTSERVKAFFEQYFRPSNPQINCFTHPLDSPTNEPKP